MNIPRIGGRSISARNSSIAVEYMVYLTPFFEDRRSKVAAILRLA
jgi:hypothetical protein